MSKVFYDYLVVREEIIEILDIHKLSPEERDELVRLVDETLHHHVLDTILRHLPQEKHEKFLTDFHKAPYDPGLLEYLKREIKADIEAEIKKEVGKVKQEILAEIRKSNK